VGPQPFKVTRLDEGQAGKEAIRNGGEWPVPKEVQHIGKLRTQNRRLLGLGNAAEKEIWQGPKRGGDARILASSGSGRRDGLISTANASQLGCSAVEAYREKGGCSAPVVK